ncbi:Protein MAIN-LIKE 2 [Glycine max]|nr:Protein MAIN-LIKE 2 [Glycine max]
MVRTKGLALRTQVSGDADEAPQRRRLTTYARGQRITTPIAENVEHMDLAIDEERPKLKLSSHRRKIEGIVTATGLSLLIACSLDTRDKGLIFAFAERWYKETSSFHLSVEEVTITLNDMASLLHLPITYVFHTFDALHADQVVDLLIELLEVNT